MAGSGRMPSRSLSNVKPRGDEYTLGDRIRVRRDRRFGPGPWPSEPNGTIAAHPLSEEGAIWRAAATTSGPRRFYWIVFDVPQSDTDGDGPYEMAEVLDIYLESATTD